MKCLYCDSHIHPYPTNGLCPNCGATLPPDNTPTWQPQPASVMQRVVVQPPSGLYCPKCRTQSIRVKKRGFGWVGAIIGFLFLPPFGILFGLIGKDKLICTCQTCSYRWKC